jgi:hypothetical protein
VVIANKVTGEVEREISSETWRGAVDIFVDLAAGKFYVLGATEVYELPLFNN